MISPSGIKEFLNSLKIENNEQEMEEIVESIINRLNSTANNSNQPAGQSAGGTQTSADEETRKQEETLKCKLYGFLLAKIGDRFWEKHSRNENNNNQR